MSTIRTSASAAWAATHAVSTSCSGRAYPDARAVTTASSASTGESLAAAILKPKESLSVTVHAAPPGRQLEGTSVLVAGAGLAGLAAARDLIALGARVIIVDARSRVGGRVLTTRDAF